MKIEDVVSYSWECDRLPGGVTVWPYSVGLLTGYGPSRRGSTLNVAAPHLVLRGSGVFCCPAGRFEVRAGDLFCIWPGVPYEFWENPDDPWQFHWMSLTGPGQATLIADWGFAPDRPLRHPAAPEKAAHVFREMFEYWGKSGERQVYHGLTLFFHMIAVSAPELPGDTASAAAERVREARTLIESTLETGINVTQLAERLQTGRATLWRAFREVEGMTVVQYLRQARLARAVELLDQTSYTMSTIASLCGFGDEKYFLRCFKENTGMTPAQWRQRKKYR